MGKSSSYRTNPVKEIVMGREGLDWFNVVLYAVMITVINLW